MMVLIIMAFCGDAGQYLVMAVAKVLELYRSRKKTPPAQKRKRAAKPAAAKPQPIDPETEAVMLRHINFRIT